MGAPFYYDFQNVAYSQVSPSTVHVRDSELSFFWRRNLLQRALYPLKFTLPKTWAKNYVLYTLFERGFLTVFNTDRWGIIPQDCTLSGYDVFYQPKYCKISNPLIDSSVQLEIGKNCSLIRLQPDYSGLMPIVNFYADTIAMCCESAGVNIKNCMVAYVFASSNKAAAQTFKKMFDEIQAGNPATFIDKDLFRDDGSPNWIKFDSDVARTFIADDLLLLIKKYLCMFDSEIGIPNTNTEKRAQMTADEVTSNSVETATRLELMYETLSEDIERCRNMFGLSEKELNVEKRKGVGIEQRREPVTSGVV